MLIKNKLSIIFFLIILQISFTLSIVLISDSDSNINFTNTKVNDPDLTSIEDDDMMNIEGVFKELGFMDKEVITINEYKLFILKLLSRGFNNLSEVETSFFEKVASKIVRGLGSNINTKDISSHLNPEFLNTILGEMSGDFEHDRQNNNLSEEKRKDQEFRKRVETETDRKDASIDNKDNEGDYTENFNENSNTMENWDNNTNNDMLDYNISKVDNNENYELNKENEINEKDNDDLNAPVHNEM